MLPSMFQSSTVPLLEQTVQFTESRHNVLAANIANMETPGYLAQTVSFQDSLSKALSDGSPAAAHITTARSTAATNMNGNNVALTLFARGLLIHVQTRAYFDGDPLNESDPLLASLDPPRRATLVARPVGEQNGIPTWRMDIRLQGVDETVFLEI